MIEYCALVLAAGKGKRMKAGENKQFINMEGKPLIIHTLEVFLKDDWCHSIVLVVNEQETERMKQIVNSQSLHSKPIDLAIGGNERQESVYKGLTAMKDKTNLVFIHDGARPFVTVETLHRLAEVTKEKQAALLAVPVTDTIKKRNGEQLTTLDRSSLWAAQTPQAFTYELIYQAHQKAVADAFIGTDDASLVERQGFPIEIVEGSYQNIKLTTPADLEWASAYIKDKMK